MKLPNKYIPKPGDLIFWNDGTPGILVKRFDIYNRPNGGDWKSCWSWTIAFTGPEPFDYNPRYGVGELNMLNNGMIPRLEANAMLETISASR